MTFPHLRFYIQKWQTEPLHNFYTRNFYSFFGFTVKCSFALPVAHKNAELRCLISSVVKGVFERADWTEPGSKVLDSHSIGVSSILPWDNFFFRKSQTQRWLKGDTTEFQSNDVVQPTTLVQNCATQVVNIRFRVP